LKGGGVGECGVGREGKDCSLIERERRRKEEGLLLYPHGDLFFFQKKGRLFCSFS
jgi:hypothetical protein